MLNFLNPLIHIILGQSRKMTSLLCSVQISREQVHEDKYLIFQSTNERQNEKKKEKQGKLLVTRTICYYELCFFKGVTARKINDIRLCFNDTRGENCRCKVI